ncbi:hypothetical protein HDV62DRAFT_352109 [Trichoderma sp. SZMC 28011]
MITLVWKKKGGRDEVVLLPFSVAFSLPFLFASCTYFALLISVRTSLYLYLSAHRLFVLYFFPPSIGRGGCVRNIPTTSRMKLQPQIIITNNITHTACY